MSAAAEYPVDHVLGDDVVDVTDLVCPGCWSPVVDLPPAGWPARAGHLPEFSHEDGSVLCPDGAGRVPGPVETGGLRYALTEQGSGASLDVAREWWT